MSVLWCHLQSFDGQGVRDAAQRKLLDEVAFLLKTCLLMDSFLWIECCIRHLLMGSEESTNIITSYLLTQALLFLWEF